MIKKNLIFLRQPEFLCSLNIIDLSPLLESVNEITIGFRSLKTLSADVFRYKQVNLLKFIVAQCDYCLIFCIKIYLSI